MITKNRLGL